MAPRKQETITFKADQALAQALHNIPNRSEFIREALQAALDGVCPLCGGTGALTVDQRRHWQAFTRQHALRQCADCDAVHLVCDAADHKETPA